MRGFFSCAFEILLGAAFLASVGFLVYHLRCAEKLDYTAVGELLLVAVLSLEGVVAVEHLREARTDSQTQSLREVMHSLGAESFLDDREHIYKGIPWQDGNYLALGGEPVQWKRSGQTTEGDATYEATAAGGTARLSISRNDTLWAAIHRVAERYQEAGLLCDRRYLSEEEFFELGHRLPVLRLWGRIKNLVEHEWTRRDSPKLWRYVESLAKAAERSKDSN